MHQIRKLISRTSKSVFGKTKEFEPNCMKSSTYYLYLCVGHGPMDFRIKNVFT